MGGQQMSPEQMAAMELQQQGNGQYACGGKLYPTGGRLSDYAQYFPNMSYDELAKLIYDNNPDLWKVPYENDYMEYFGKKGWKEGEVIPYDAWLTALKNSNYNLHSWKDGFQWLLRTNDNNQKAEEQAILNALYANNPEAKNSGWTFANTPYRAYANVDFHDATSDVGNNGNKMVPETFYANDPAWGQLTE